MSRRRTVPLLSLLWLLLLVACDDGRAGEEDAGNAGGGGAVSDGGFVGITDAGSNGTPVARDSMVPPGPVDAAADLDAAENSGPPLADGATPGPDAARPTRDASRAVDAQAPDVAVVDCSPLGAAGYEVCAARADACDAVYEDGAGCEAVCARVGLPCSGGYDNLDGACAPLAGADPVGCHSGHQSDYCVCGGDGAPAVEPDAPQLGRAEALLTERLGFGRGARGGDPDRIYRVDTLDDEGPGSLRRALEDDTPWWIVFDVEGRIELDDEVRVRSRKTVDGRGRAITVDGTWRIQESQHVIISDVTMTRSVRDDERACEQDGDAVLIRGSGGDDPDDFDTRHIWIHHCELYDGGDGLLDIRGGTDITISWSRFHTHKKVTLAWSDRDGEPVEPPRVSRSPLKLGDWGHGEEEVHAGSSRARRPARSGEREGARLEVGRHQLCRFEDRLQRRDAAEVGAPG